MIKSVTKPVTLSLIQGLAPVEGYPEQLINWTFDDPLQDTDPANNILADQWYNWNATLAVSSGLLAVITTNAYGSASQKLNNLEEGKTYKFRAEAISGVARVFLGTGNNGDQIKKFDTNSTGTEESPAVFEHTFTWGADPRFYVRMMTHTTNIGESSIWTFASLKEI